MPPMQQRLALHPWTLDTTPLPDLLRIARATGWNAVELRRKDLERARAAGWSVEQLRAQLDAHGLAIAAVGVEPGWLYATGAEQRRLFEAFADSCRTAAALGGDLVMSPIGPGEGTDEQAATSLRAAGDLAGEHGLRLAFEFQAQHPYLCTVERARALLAVADHPRCGLLLDTYHLCRSGRPGGAFADVPAEEIYFVQYSDAPTTPPLAGPAVDRLPPGQGVARLGEFFARLAEQGYAGYLSYEAPNPATWARDPAEAADEAITATRALLAQSR